MKRARKRPLDGHPRADETRAAMLAAHFEDEVEVIQASELACDVADAFVRLEQYSGGSPAERQRLIMVLDEHTRRLELVTRPSAMRKARS